MQSDTVEDGRLTRAARAVLNGSCSVEEVEPGTYTVSSFSSTRSYRVTLNPEPRCTCPDSACRGVICKHLTALELHQRAASMG